MKFDTINNIAYTGSYLGTISGVSYKELTDRLGPSSGPSMDGKVKAQWMIKFEDGNVADIYAWKIDLPVKANKTWNIGGRSSIVVPYVFQIFGKKREAIEFIFTNQQI